jgi:hypothetical protein
MAKQEIDQPNFMPLLRIAGSILKVDGNHRVAALRYLRAMVTLDRHDEADLQPLPRPRRRGSARYRRDRRLINLRRARQRP